MQALDKTIPQPRCSDYIERAVLRIDHRCSDNSHIAVHIGTAVLAVVDVGRRTEVDMPKRLGRARIVGVKGIYAVVYGGDIDHVMRTAAYSYIRHIQRLAVNLVINNSPEQHSKLLLVHVRRGEDDFIQIRSSALVVIVLRQHAYLGSFAG